MQKYRKVYHITDKANLDRILTDGLQPLAKNRPKELKIADIAFDIAARRLGIMHRRKGIFAWPTEEMAKGGTTNQSTIIEIETNAQTALVLHQAWIDLAWGVLEGVVARLPPARMHNIELLLADAENEVFKKIKKIAVYEGLIGEVLIELAGFYWGTGVRLADYNEETAQALNQKVKDQLKRYQGLMPGLGHEVALGRNHIPRYKMEIMA